MPQPELQQPEWLLNHMALTAMIASKMPELVDGPLTQPVDLLLVMASEARAARNMSAIATLSKAVD